MYVYVICILYNMARRDKKCLKKFFFFSFAVETFLSNARVRGLIKVSDLKSYNITQTVWFQQINNRVQSKISLAEE